MLRRFLFIGLGVLAIQHAQAADDTTQVLFYRGVSRRYIVHVPPNYNAATQFPLVLNFHASGAKPETQRQNSQFNPVADKNGFIVVYPEGVKRTWNAGMCCGYAEWQNIDDVGFVRELLLALKKKYAVDPKRVYATGFSNGAMFAYRLACEMPDQIAAVGVVAGGLGVDGPEPTRPVPVIHIHGLRDENYPFNGGVGPRSTAKVSFRAVSDTIGWWVRVNRCALTPVDTQKSNDFFMERYERAPGQSGAPVVLYRLTNSGHSWPRKPLSASDVIWEFLSKQALP
jgi:polyhydroxybutyrate depolymerase